MKLKVLEIVSHTMKVPVESVNENSSPQNTETWDSLKHMELVFALEEEFNVQFSEDQISSMLNVRYIIETISLLSMPLT